MRAFIAERSKSMREEKLEHLREFFAPGNLVLDVGVWGRMPEPNPSENWLEKRHSDEARIVAVGLEDLRAFRKKYPRVLCVQADGRALPFKADAVAAAFSNAVLEHVPLAGQLRFVEEIARVTRRRAVLAVPDRWSPIEIHSRIFFLHWLPFWRPLFRLLGEPYWASEAGLSTIFTRSALKELLGKSSVPGKWIILRQFLFFLPVSLIAVLEKDTMDKA